MKKSNALLLRVIVTLSLMLVFSSSSMAQYPDAERFEQNILSFEQKDAEQFPPEGAIVLTGSSSIARWQHNAAEVLAPLTVIPRGFGGSNMNDALHYLERVALIYKPRAILLYEGDNDTGVTPPIPNDEILSKLRQIIAIVHQELPETRLYLLSIKPSVLRQGAWPTAMQVNKAYQEIAHQDPLVYYVDVSTPFLKSDGTVMTDIFISDDLHFNEKGNEIWGRVIREALLPIEGQYE